MHSGLLLEKRYIILGDRDLTIQDVVDFSRAAHELALSPDPAFRERIESGADQLRAQWQSDKSIYGVTTGVGESCLRPIPKDLVPLFSRNLARFHGCGLGDYFDEATSAAVLLTRIASLVRGYSAVRYLLLERLCLLGTRRLIPRIPEEGSVGASGDLTPLSYIAAVLMGEREAWFEDQIRPAADIFAQLGLEPLALEPKEGLALMNGTSVMTALAALAVNRAGYLSRLCARIGAAVIEALIGNKAHYDPRIFQVKPFPGQARVAARIATDLEGAEQPAPLLEYERIQDTYALRCAPHIIGVLEDALPWMRQHVEIELNSANDNPLFDPESGEALHGGNFYGGHMAFVADSLKNATANIADLLDRQMALLMNFRRNRGLPANLTGVPLEQQPVHHGFKAVQIGCSAWAAEALKLTMPASVFSRSTESHNQDKVSMGTISARDALRVLQLTEQVAAATMLGAVQALELRIRDGQLIRENLSSGIQTLMAQTRSYSPFLGEDRPLEGDLRTIIAAIQSESFEVAE